jgi:hypothetical protein
MLGECRTFRFFVKYLLQIFAEGSLLFRVSYGSESYPEGNL